MGSLLSPEVWRCQQVLKGHLPLGLLLRLLRIYETTLFPLLLICWPGVGEGTTQIWVTYVHRDSVANIKRSPAQKLYSPKQMELSEIPACSELTRPDSQCAPPQHGHGCRTSPRRKCINHQLCMSNSSGCTGTAGEEGKVSEGLLSELHQ